MILAINTAGSLTEIALLKRCGKNDIVILEETHWPSKNNEAELLLPNIDTLLKKQNADFKSINEILVVSGPGSFTGLRIGVTVANTVASLSKAKLYSMDTFEYHWLKIDFSEKGLDTNKLALLVFAGAKGVYVSRFGKKAVENINIEQINHYLKSNSINRVFGDISKSQKDLLQISTFVDVHKSLGEIVQGYLHDSKPKHQKMVLPNYLKEPSITLSKKHVFNQK